MGEFIIKLDIDKIPDCCGECEMPDAICDKRMVMWFRDTENGRVNGFHARHPDCPIVGALNEKNVAEWLARRGMSIISWDLLHEIKRSGLIMSPLPEVKDHIADAGKFPV